MLATQENAALGKPKVNPNSHLYDLSFPFDATIENCAFTKHLEQVLQREKTLIKKYFANLYASTLTDAPPDNEM